MTVSVMRSANSPVIFTSEKKKGKQNKKLARRAVSTVWPSSPWTYWILSFLDSYGALLYEKDARIVTSSGKPVTNSNEINSIRPKSQLSIPIQAHTLIITIETAIIDIASMIIFLDAITIAIMATKAIIKITFCAVFLKFKYVTFEAKI